MDNKENKIDVDKALNELSDDELENISGGRISAPGYAALLAVIQMYKKKGFTKEYAIKDLINGWNQGSHFRYLLTDNTDKDFENMVKFIESVW